MSQTLPIVHDIQPRVNSFCAPEVLFYSRQAGLGSADIWNLGIVAGDFDIKDSFLCTRANFYFVTYHSCGTFYKDISLLDGPRPENDRYSREAYFAQMIDLPGPRPQELLDRADSATLCSLYTAQGVYDSTNDDGDDDAHDPPHDRC